MVYQHNEGATRAPSQGTATAIWLANLPADGPSGSFFPTKNKSSDRILNVIILLWRNTYYTPLRTVNISIE